MAQDLEPYACLNKVNAHWANSGKRAEIIEQLAERGVDFQTVAAHAGKPDAGPFDLLCHLLEK